MGDSSSTALPRRGAPPVAPDLPAVALPRPEAGPARDVAELSGDGRIVTPTNGYGSAALPRAAMARRARRITAEGACWALLIVVAILTRFWDLGSRTLHHDESLHAYYSWGYATGIDDYVHHPLMHGPFLFHANALVYFLLGATDASSRYVPALAGVGIVALPYLLRGPRHLGRYGALAAGALLLISPSIWYMSRYIRHDIYTVFGTLLLFIATVRYLERPERRWLITVGATLGFLLTNHEIVFGLAAIFVAFLWGTLLLGRLRPLIPLHLIFLAGVGAILTFSTRIGDLFDDVGIGPVASFFHGLGRHLPAIPWRSPTREQSREYYVDLLTHPLIVLAIVALVAFVVAARFVLNAHRDRDREEEGWLGSLLGGSPPGSVERGVLNVWRDRAGLAAALGVGAAIFVLLYTSLFSNMEGLASGTVATDGTLFYWLGQHDYRRGMQPWFYYLLLMPQYEFFAVLFGGAAGLLALWAAARRLLRRGADPRLFFRLFLLVWFVAIFGILSWAGEKMPWLLTHIALPGTLLAASLIGELVERGVAARRNRALANASGEGRAAHRWVEPALVASLLVAGGCWYFLAGRFSYGQFVQGDAGDWERALTTGALDRWWLLALPPLAALVLLAAAWVGCGARRAGWASLVALTIGIALLQVHVAWRFTYLEGDIPKDMLVYTQTSPDMSRMVRELGALSREVNGGKDLELWVDTKEISWPLQWYLRDFPNRTFTNAATASPPPSADIVLVSSDNRGRVEGQGQFDDELEGYTEQEYVLRWHFPEHDYYREFAIAPEITVGWSAWESADQPHAPLDYLRSIGDSLGTQLDPDGQAATYRLVMYRDLPMRIAGYNYSMYVRNDLVPLLNGIRY